MRHNTFYSTKINPTHMLQIFYQNILNILYCSLGPFLKKVLLMTTVKSFVIFEFFNTKGSGAETIMQKCRFALNALTHHTVYIATIYYVYICLSTIPKKKKKNATRRRISPCICVSSPLQLPVRISTCAIYTHAVGKRSERREDDVR